MSDDIVERLQIIARELNEGRPQDAMAIATILASAAEIERLQDRLEMRYAWQAVDGVLTRISVPVGSIPDGIECRDETIRLLEAQIERLRALGETGR